MVLDYFIICLDYAGVFVSMKVVHCLYFIMLLLHFYQDGCVCLFDLCCKDVQLVIKLGFDAISSLCFKQGESYLVVSIKFRMALFQLLQLERRYVSYYDLKDCCFHSSCVKELIV